MPIPSGSPSRCTAHGGIGGSDHQWVILAERRKVACLSRFGHSENYSFEEILPGAILKKH
jgi:hypothetical protein